MSAIITNISRTTDGYYWRYNVTATGTYDVWLDGLLLEENVATAYYDYLTSEPTPPPIEVCDYGARCTNSWASRNMTVQWFNAGYKVFAVQEWRAGALYSTRYVEVQYPERYCQTTVIMASKGAIEQVWTVRPAVKTDAGNYYITGAAVEITMRRHYLPRVPNVSYTYDAAAQQVTIR